MLTRIPCGTRACLPWPGGRPAGGRKVSAPDALISVVIPTYNRARTLPRAVRSVLEQDGVTTEIIVVDDASDSPAVEALVAEVRLVTRELNGGVAAAQNTGVKEARGAYVCFLHSDDELLPGALNRGLEALSTAGPEVCGVEAASLRVTPHGEVALSARTDGCTAGELLMRHIRNVHITPWLFRTSAVLAVGGFDERLRAVRGLRPAAPAASALPLQLGHGTGVPSAPAGRRSPGLVASDDAARPAVTAGEVRPTSRRAAGPAAGVAGVGGRGGIECARAR